MNATLKIGRKGYVCGRKVEIVAVFSNCIRVRYLEQSMRGKMLDKPFTPFEANVSKSYWYCPA